MKHVRIQLDGNKTYLVYKRGLIQEYAIVHLTRDGSQRYTGLSHAVKMLRRAISL